LAGALLRPLPAVAQEVTVSTGAQYALGEYIFTEETELFAWTTGLSVRQGRVEVGVSVPLLVQTQPWLSYGGIGPTPSGGPQHGVLGQGRNGPQRGRRTPIALPDTGAFRNTGLGDPLVRASYDLPVGSDTSRLRVQLTGTLKPPVADADEGFSTGAWDGGLGVALARAFAPWFLLAEGTYWRLGDLEALPLNDVFSYSVGTGRSVYRGRGGVLASFSGSTTVISGTDPPISLTGGFSYTPAPWTLSATASSGLTEGAADWTVGLGLSVTLRR
jgi:hypothetical protein